MTTRVFIIPAPYKDAGNTMAMAMGWGQPVFVQPLSATGQEPITHWGFPAVVDGNFTELWSNPPEEAAGIVAATYTDDREGMDTAGHWRDVLLDRGVKVVQMDEGLA